MPGKLNTITIHGFKTIRELDNFELCPINLLIGANGAGKSNFVSFFRMMNWMLGSPGELQEYIARLGGAQAILHDGPTVTPQLEAEISLETERGANEYAFRLFHAAGDTLIFADEKYRFSDFSYNSLANWTTLESGHKESRLIENSELGNQTAKVILSLLRQCVVYQFHNTSQTSRIRNKWNISDARWLKEDGGNLAPFLMRLREYQPEYYRRIVEIIRSMAPFFADFELRSDYDRVLLQWRERGSDVIFDASQASDGMLRIFSLITLLAQPKENLPDLLILDEPELGLHPYAINVVAGLIKSLARHIQIIIATQSAALVDHFEPEDVVVVDREGRESQFRRLDSKALSEWLEEYTLSELWDKNVLGGRPFK